MKQSLPEISLEGVMGWLRENLLLVLTFSGDLILFCVVFCFVFTFVCLCLLLFSFYDVFLFCCFVTVVVFGVVVDLLLMLLFILGGTVDCCCYSLFMFLLLFAVKQSKSISHNKIVIIKTGVIRGFGPRMFCYFFYCSSC